jgi:hypothetical protein
MNRADYTRSDRYPLSTQGLNFIQEQILLLQDIIAMLGGGKGKYIIKGCETTDAMVQPGVVAIDGELLRIEVPTLLQPTCYIGETTNDSPHRVFRRLVFGELPGGTNYAWSEFQRIDITELATRQELEFEASFIFPKGGIIMWSGSMDSMPNGFELCDGGTANGLQKPDLRGRFVVGYHDSVEEQYRDYSRIGATGGEPSVALKEENNAPHEHYLNGFGYNNGADDSFSGDGSAKFGRYSGWVKNQMSVSGSGVPHENRPPYYVLAYIIKVV